MKQHKCKNFEGCGKYVNRPGECCEECKQAARRLDRNDEDNIEPLVWRVLDPEKAVTK